MWYSGKGISEWNDCSSFLKTNTLGLLADPVVFEDGGGASIFTF
jgi:hypothetical protein